MIYFLEGKFRMALDLRADAIAQKAKRDGFGAVKINLNPDEVGDPRESPAKFVSKIALAPVSLPGDTLDSIQWKPSPVIVVVVNTTKPPVNVDKLNEIEAALPGFIAKFGPSETITL